MTDPAKSPMLTTGKAARCADIMRALLAPGERLVALADVSSVAPLTLAVAVTDQRLIGVPKSAERPVDLQIPRGQLRGFRFDKKLLFSYLIGITDDGETNFGIALSDERKFLEGYLKQLISPNYPLAGKDPQRLPPPPPSPTFPGGPPAQQLRNPDEPTSQATQAAISLIKKTKPSPAAAPESTIADELVKLADLHERGVLTDAEFQTAKAAVINRAD